MCKQLERLPIIRREVHNDIEDVRIVTGGAGNYKHPPIAGRIGSVEWLSRCDAQGAAPAVVVHRPCSDPVVGAEPLRRAARRSAATERDAKRYATPGRCPSRVVGVPAKYVSLKLLADG